METLRASFCESVDSLVVFQGALRSAQIRLFDLRMAVFGIFFWGVSEVRSSKGLGAMLHTLHTSINTIFFEGPVMQNLCASVARKEHTYPKTSRRSLICKSS